MMQLLRAAACCAALVTGLTCASAQTTTASDALAGRVIVKFKSDSPLATAKITGGRAKALGTRTGLALSDGPELSPQAQVVIAPGTTSEALAQRLAAQADVEYAVPDQRRRIRAAPNDPLYLQGPADTGPLAGQWYLRSPASGAPSSINIEPAWSVTQGSTDVIVAVLDTGVRFDHPDLLAVSRGGTLLPGYDMISDSRIANDGDGRDADPSDPGDWVTASEANTKSSAFYQCTDVDPSTGRYVAEDSSWHGTQTAGLIGALTNNGTGMASVAPNVRLLPVRVLGKCGGFDSDIIAGMRWAAGLSVPGAPLNTNVVRVINLSLGAEGSCPSSYVDAMRELTARGVIVVAAAGNEAGHASGTPANCPGVVSVAALRHAGTKVGFSDLGPAVAISAPGGNCVNTDAGSPCLYPILTTTDAGTTTPAGGRYTDSFRISVGTSFSSPLVAGAMALLVSARPSITPGQALAVLQATSRSFPTTNGESDSATVPACTAPRFDAAGHAVDQLQCYCTTFTCGAGMLDAGAAVTALTTSVAPTAAIEYYWPARDHYFVTSIPGEIAFLDGSADWKRTGESFNVYPRASGTSSRVCRMYVPEASGNSHFFSAAPVECATVEVAFPAYVKETDSAFFIDLPDPTTGACPANDTPVYRLWNNRADTNHRYTTSTAIRDAMRARGYIAEGYGPDAVAMCSPR